MDIFISWSGERSKRLAEILRDWIPNVIQAVNTWTSESDIDKGARWLKEISEKLGKTNFGIICLTPENMSEPWILFEAGALSKSLENSRVCCILDFEPTDLKGPLSHFQATRINKEDMLKLFQTINKNLSSGTLLKEKLKSTFELWWPEFERQVKAIPEPATKTQTHRKDRDILEEVLKIVRNLERKASQSSNDYSSNNEINTILEIYLSPREEKVLRMKFGLGEKQKYSDEEIAKVLGVPIKDIKLIANKALRTLRMVGIEKP